MTDVRPPERATPRRPPRAIALAALLVLGTVAGSGTAAGQGAVQVDAAALERLCLANAPDEVTREACLVIVRTVLAPGGVLVPPVPEAPEPAVEEQGVGVTQATSTLLVTLMAVEWDAGLFSSDEADVIAAELAFESLQPEAYVDPSGLVAIDADGFAHAWGAIHRMGDAPLGGFLAQGRRQRGWVGFEVPEGTDHVDIEYLGSEGERLVWTVRR